MSFYRSNIEIPPWSCYITTAVVSYYHRGHVILPPQSSYITTEVEFCSDRTQDFIV
jgi:hypothetical protein